MNKGQSLQTFELWFLCNALLLNEIYLLMKFHVDALHCCKIMLRTKKGRLVRRTDGRTDGLTDESITICHPSGAYFFSKKGCYYTNVITQRYCIQLRGIYKHSQWTEITIQSKT